MNRLLSIALVLAITLQSISAWGTNLYITCKPEYYDQLSQCQDHLRFKATSDPVNYLSHYNKCIRSKESAEQIASVESKAREKLASLEEKSRAALQAELDAPSAGPCGAPAERISL
jgi:hypothetical protein